MKGKTTEMKHELALRLSTLRSEEILHRDGEVMRRHGSSPRSFHRHFPRKMAGYPNPENTETEDQEETGKEEIGVEGQITAPRIRAPVSG